MKNFRATVAAIVLTASMSVAHPVVAQDLTLDTKFLADYARAVGCKTDLFDIRAAISLVADELGEVIVGIAEGFIPGFYAVITSDVVGGSWTFFMVDNETNLACMIAKGYNA